MSGGRRTAAGWEGNLPSEMIFFGAHNLVCTGRQMGQSSLELMGVCPFHGAAALLSL